MECRSVPTVGAPPRRDGGHGARAPCLPYILGAMSLMLRVPFRSRAAHVVPLGPVGRTGKVDQPVAMDHDFRQASKQRLQDQHGSLSMQLAEHR
jgi:hypothetical protein